MKKVLTLVLVLAVAQLATAAVWWDVSDAGGGQFNVALQADENVQTVSLAKLISDGATFEVSPLDDAGIWNSDFVGTNSGFMDLASYDEGYGNALGTQGSSTGTYATGTLVSFQVTGNLGDNITVQDLGAFGVNSYITTEASNGSVGFVEYDNGSLQNFELVPEPMTMALLGLGGLFVRRRRA